LGKKCLQGRFLPALLIHIIRFCQAAKTLNLLSNIYADKCAGFRQSRLASRHFYILGLVVTGFACIDQGLVGFSRTELKYY